MRLFAFAALLALSLLGLGAQSASADYYCCGRRGGEVEHKIGWTKVKRDSAIFDCDSYDCQTKIKIREGTKVKVYCRNGWCHIKNFRSQHMWVLEECLKSFDRGEEESEGEDESNGDDGEGESESESEGDEENGEGGDRYRSEAYKRYHHRRY